MGDCLLAIDQGTTGSTVILFDARGRAVGRGYREITQHYPVPGWVEHDASEIWTRTLEAAAECLAASEGAGRRIAGIGITNQRETFLLWDRATGAPVGPAVVWQCRRTAADCRELEAAGLGELVRRESGLVLDAYFSGPKLRWLFRRDPALLARAKRGELAFGTIDSWLLYKLTGGVHATDVTNAGRTMLFDIRKLAWSDALLGALDVPGAILPEVRPSASDFGTTAPGLPLPAGVPVAAMAGDQHAALFGQACFEPGSAKNTYGTGCFLLLNTGETPVTSHNRLLTTLAWQREGRPALYALEGSVFVAGAAIQWLRDELGILATAAESEALARTVGDTGGVYMVPAFTGLGAPHWDGFARGALLGLTRGSGKAQIARAALEAIAYQSKDVLDAMTLDSGRALASLRVDGGAAANDFLMQFQADMLGAPVVRRANVEATAWGAAALAGCRLGFWDEAALGAMAQEERIFTPAMPAAERERLHAGWRKAVERAKGWAL